MNSFLQEDTEDCLFDIYSIPSVVIVDKRGEIVFQDSGAADWSDDSVVQYLIQLTKE